MTRKSSRFLHISKTYLYTDLLPVWRADETGTATELFRLNGRKKRPHRKSTRAACDFREETRRKAIFLKQTEKVKQNFTQIAAFL